ncbi:hypothetical protein L211DRAFT_159206 [Terfezia boudieri ATCC MYA-4762]|uniref:Uncharacterized protein n=1 Tax=Terfezia boudieri ATCC MYA-4762 TaxID=1051890 RepID=A0A3N4LPX9_9PEZI|nr:hypothetical protein L211DRAFT_159206 [Terfezia boudieri ATCC MYA-4762]
MGSHPRLRADPPAREPEGFMAAAGSMERNLNSAQWKAVVGLMDLLCSRVGALILDTLAPPIPLHASRTFILQPHYLSPHFRAYPVLLRLDPTNYTGINGP